MVSFIMFSTFLVYNFFIFSYLDHIYMKVVVNKKLYYLTYILNGGMIAWIFITQTLVYELPLMMIYFVFVGIEAKFIYKDSWLKIIFGVVFFTVNFFSIRLMYIGLYALVFDLTVLEIMLDFDRSIFISTLVLVTTTPIIAIFKNYFSQEYLNIILSDKKSLKFATIIVSSIFVYLIINTSVLYSTEYFPHMPLYQIKIAFCTMVGSLCGIIHAYIFAKFNTYAVKSNNIKKEIEDDEAVLKILEEETNIDEFTGCATLNFALAKMDILLKNNMKFALIYMDIDGLKITNDIYGHDEGDFYIKAVCNIFFEEFIENTVARMGGDEFLIIMENAEGYDALSPAIRCFEKVKKLSIIYNKPYKTSISYGILEVDTNNTMTKNELLEAVDSRMYSFKKRRKKGREIKKF